MAAQRQLRALRNDRNLRRFVVQARPTGRQLGTGSYGTVEEVVAIILLSCDNYFDKVTDIVYHATCCHTLSGGVERASLCWKEDP